MANYDFSFNANRWVSERLETVQITAYDIHNYHFCETAEKMIKLTESGECKKIPVYVPREGDPGIIPG